MRYYQLLLFLLFFFLTHQTRAQVPPCTSLTNLSLNGTATQSSTKSGGDADHAIDGNTNGSYYHPDQSVTSTNYEEDAWWQVDLGELKSVNNIRIWNQTNGNSTADFYIFSSAYPLSADLNTNLNDPNVLQSFFSGDAESPSVSIFLENQLVRYVQIHRDGWGFVTLAELEVMGCDVTTSGEDTTPPNVTITAPGNVVNATFTLNVDFTEPVADFDLDDINLGNALASVVSGGAQNYTVQITPTGSPVILRIIEGGVTDYAGNGNLYSNELELLYTDPNATPVNLALNKTATQETDHSAWGTADKAVDGNTNGSYYHPDQSVSQTTYGEDRWWQVDLDSIFDIGAVKLFNQTGGNSTEDFYVFISEVPFTSYDLNTTLNQSGVSNYYFSGDMDSPTIVQANRKGRYIRVQTDGWGFATLAEVEVNPPPLTTTGPDENTYAQLKKKLDGSFVTFADDEIYFKYIEDYAITSGVNNQLRLNVYDESYTLQTTGTVTNNYGINWITFNPMLQALNEYYILEVSGGNKGEKYYLRFTYE